MNIISPDFRGEWQAAVEAALGAALPYRPAVPDPTPSKVKVSGSLLIVMRYPSGFT